MAVSNTFALIRNESFKWFHRPSARWLTALLIVLAAGFYGILQLLSFNAPSHGTTPSGIQAQIDYYETEQPDGYEAEIARLQVILENQLDTSCPNWRLSAAGQIAEATRLMLEYERSSRPKDMEQATRLAESIAMDREFIRQNDWVGYYEKKLEEVLTNPDLSAEKRENLTWQYQYVLDYQIAAGDSLWKFALYEQILSAKKELAEEQAQEEQGIGINREQSRTLQEQILINEYRIERDLEHVANVNPQAAAPSVSFWGITLSASGGYWGYFQQSLQLFPLLTLLFIFWAGGMMSGEFSCGTIRLLLIREPRRGRLLLCKTAALFLWIIGFAVGLFVLSGFICGLFRGFSEAGADYLYVSKDAVHAVSGFAAMGLSYLCELPRVIAYTMLAFCLCTLTRNTVLSVGISACLLFTGDLLSSAAAAVNSDLPRYLLFSNLDLNAIRSGSTFFSGQSVGFALLVIAIYLLLFFWIAWDSFVRRDIRE